MKIIGIFSKIGATPKEVGTGVANTIIKTLLTTSVGELTKHIYLAMVYNKKNTDSKEEQ